MDEMNFDSRNCKEAVCIQTQQVYDSCRAKECLEDLRVYLPASAQNLLDRATSVKCRNAEIIWVFTDVEPLPFNRGFYTVDLKFYFRITLDLYTCAGSPSKVCGFAAYEKKVALFGSEGSAKIFSSDYKKCEFDSQNWMKTNLPRAVVEVVDPVCLSARIADACEPCCSSCEFADPSGIPDAVHQLFDGGLLFSGEQKRVYVSLGLFTIVKLERETQLLIPAYDFCIPDKDCVTTTEKDPCELFEQLGFPIDDFFPPIKGDFVPDNTGDGGCCN